MLCLSRRVRQRVFIGPDIAIEVLEVTRGGYVRLGITAPKELAITRDDCKSVPPASDEDNP
jgi:carbon storage regulator